MDQKAKDDAEDKEAAKVFEIPVKKYPGMSKNVLRKRKPFIWKKIDYKMWLF